MSLESIHSTIRTAKLPTLKRGRHDGDERRDLMCRIYDVTPSKPATTAQILARLSPRPSPLTVVGVLDDLSRIGLLAELGTTWEPHPDALHLEGSAYHRIWRRA